MNETREHVITRGGDGIITVDALDNGRFKRAVKVYDAVASDAETLVDLVWCAEVSLYLDRLDEAKEWLGRAGYTGAPGAELAARGEHGEMARRVALVAAEAEYFDGDYTEALDRFAGLARAAEAAGDAAALLRATYDSGRALRRLGRHAEAVGVFERADLLAREAGNVYYQGLVAYNRAFSTYELNDIERARSLYVAALGRLRESEDLRFRAICECAYGCLLTDTGEADLALALFASAEETAVSLGVVPDALNAGIARARVLLMRRQAAQAERDLSALVEWSRGLRQSYAERLVLTLLVIARCECGRYDEALPVAEECARLAAAVGTPADRLDAQILLQRVRALAGQAGASDNLRKLVGQADRDASDFLRAEARVYMAEVLRRERSSEAASWLEEALSFDVSRQAGWLSGVIDRVRQEIEMSPIRRGPRGELVIDTSVEFPTLEEVRDAVDRYMFEQSVKVAGNPTAAGRLIGQTAYQMFCLKRYLSGRLPRPSRAQGAAKRTRRKRRLDIDPEQVEQGGE